VDVAPVLRGEPAQVEQLDRDPRRSSEYLACDFEQAIRFRHFTRTGVFAAGRTVDQQNGRFVAFRVAALRIGDRRAGRQPVERKIIVWIGKFVARFARARSLATVLVGVPRDGHDLVEF
jgi:hypothetical protein